MMSIQRLEGSVQAGQQAFAAAAQAFVHDKVVTPTAARYRRLPPGMKGP